MKIGVKVELTSADLKALAQIAGVSFLSGDAIAEQLTAIIQRELRPGVDLGILYGLIYYREDPNEESGYSPYMHVMQGEGWPHKYGRPRVYWDGKQMRTRGGAFTVDASRGIVDLPLTAGEQSNARAS